MPFIAINMITDERVDISEIENPRAQLRNGEYVCQICKLPMLIKGGSIIRYHFAHYPAAECTGNLYKRGHPESLQHDFAKKEVARMIREDIRGRLDGVTVDYEVPIPEAQRIADVLVSFPMGWRVAHEVQLAKISINDLEERTNDYNNAGIDVFWWLGKDADTQSNRDWCVGRFGFSLRINIIEHKATDNPAQPSAFI